MRIARILLLLITIPAASPAPASDLGFHTHMTEKVLRERGWTDPEAVREVARANLATDLARVSAVELGVVRAVWPRTWAMVPPVDAVAATAPFNPARTDSLHFNALYSFDAVARRWDAFGAWVDSLSADLAARGRPAAETRVFLGVVLHAVQDFYEHANWFVILDRFAPRGLSRGEYPLWEELVLNRGGWRERHPEFDSAGALNRFRASNAILSDHECLGGLQTGRTRTEPWTAPVKPWMHRHQLGPDRDAVAAISERALHLWLDRVEARLFPAE